MALLLLFLALATAVPPGWETCPNGDMELPRATGDVCIGRLADRYAFGFAWTAEAAAIPELDALLRAEAEQRERWMSEQSDPAWAEREEAGGEPVRFTYEEAWELDADTPALAAASGSARAYTGGAHGGIAYHVILLDRRSGRQIALAELFTDPAAGMAAVQTSFCPYLQMVVRIRRDNDDEQVECPAAADHPVTLEIDEEGTVFAMTALLDPYVVGSWSEGPYDVLFPVTAEIAAALKPQYRSAFVQPPE